jgi:hypothetical protein
MSDDQKPGAPELSATASTSDATDTGDVLTHRTSGAGRTAASTDTGTTVTDDTSKQGFGQTVPQEPVDPSGEA